MNQDVLKELLNEAQSHGGGLVLSEGEAPKAVVLSVDAYAALLAGRPGLLTGAGSGDEGAETSAAAGVSGPAQRSDPETILVTGGAGYIGGHVVRLLLEHGYQVVVLDNFSRGKREYVSKSVTVVEGDVRDINLLRDIFAQYSIDAVIHLAALLEVQESVEKPVEYLEVNTIATGKLLLAMHEAGIRRLIFSSTAAVYGSVGAGAPLPEDAVCQPGNPYGSSKLLAERFIEYYTASTAVGATVLRFFNVAGSWPAWGITDTHESAHLIPVVLDVAHGKRLALTVYGSDFETPDGTCVRDYVHVYDIARAHIVALQNRGGRGRGQQFAVYNIGTGHGASVREVVQAAAEVTGRMVPMEPGPRRPGDDALRVADVSKIKNELGFQAEYSSVDNIIRSCWDQVMV